MIEQLEQTLRAAARGDGEAWNDLVHAYTGRVYALLYRQCGSAELAEEITQATFVKVVTQLQHYRELGRFEAWLFRIAVNRLRDEMRRRQRHARNIDITAVSPEGFRADANEPLPLEQLQARERDAQLLAAVGQLSEADQQLLNFRYTAELSFAQIAEILDEPLGTVLARGHRALKKLRKILDPDGQHGRTTTRKTPDPATEPP